MDKLVLLNKNKTSVVVYMVIFIYLLMQMRCWIGFGGVTYIAQFFLIVLLGLFGLFGLVNYQYKRPYIIFASLVFISMYIMRKAWMLNINGLIGCVIPAIIVLFVLSIPDDDKKSFLYYIVKWYGWIMIPSLVLFLITNFVSLPSIGILNADYGSGYIVSDRFYYNYFFYIRPTALWVYDFMRFNGPFLEPGDVGCTAAFILFATQFRFKEYKYLWAVLVALIASFSLAGYMLGLIAFVLTLFSQGRMKGGTFASVFLLFYSLYLFGVYYHGGDNFINDAILSRLQSDEDKYFTGNNRSTLLVMESFYEMFNNSNTALFGYNESTIEVIFEGRGQAGFFAQAIKVGMLGIVSLFLPYLLITLGAKDKRYAWCAFLLFVAFFFQRTESFWIIYIITYVYGIVINDKLKRKHL